MTPEALALGKALQQSISECETIRGLLRPDGALPETAGLEELSAVVQELKVQQSNAAGSAFTEDVAALIAEKCLAFYTELDAAIAALKTDKEAAFESA